MNTLQRTKRFQLLILLIAAICSLVVFSPTKSSAACVTLASGASLTPGQSIASCNAKYTLAFQTDGNVVLYVGKVFTPEYALWSTKTDGKTATLFAMQTDGHLVLYNGSTALWASASNGGTYGKSGYLAVQDDGNLVVYATSDASVLWASNTMQKPTELIDSVANGYTWGYAPSIIKVDNTWHMYYCSTGNPGWDDVRHATSQDGTKWSVPDRILYTSDMINERASCDPSVVYYDAGDGPYYYLFYSGNQKDVQTVNLVARSQYPVGPFSKFTTRGTWEINPPDPKVILSPVHLVPDPAYNDFINPISYGLGQPSVVVHDGVLYQWFTDSTRQYPSVPWGNDIYFATSTDPTVWSTRTQTNVVGASVDVKYDSLSQQFVMFGVGYTESTGDSILAIRTSSDGITWSDPTTILYGAEMALFSHNPGVSGSRKGELMRDFVLAAYGAPYNLRNYNNWAQWDLYGQTISTLVRAALASTVTTPTPLPLPTGAPTLTLTANGVTNPTVAEGDSHTLEWYSTDVSSCTLSYTLPGVITVGTISLIPNAAGSGTAQVGGTRTISCLGTDGTTITKTVTITVTPPIPTATSNYPRGYIESSTYATITGWAQDKDIPDSPIYVHFYIDKPPTATDFSGYAGMVSAKDYRADLCNEIGSCNRAFLFTVPAKFKDGLAHTVYAYGIDEDGVGAHNLALTPYSSASNTFQYLAATTTTSTATLTAMKQSVVLGETAILVWESTNTSSRTGTNFYRGGKRCGWGGPYPIATTTYSIPCAGNDDPSPTASVTVGVGAATSNIFYPRGYIESSNYACCRRWAQDQDIPDSPIYVHIYIDKPPTATDFSGYVGMVSAKDYRSDLCTNIGSCSHGYSFTLPTTFKDGKTHTVYVYGIDEDGIGAHNIALTPYSSTSNTFKYLAPTGAPTITSISPSSGSGSVPITITGTGFNATQNLVFLGGIGGLCGLSYLTSTASGTSIACTLGLGRWSTGTYSLTVKNVTTGLTSTGVNFTVNSSEALSPEVLSITTVSPTSGIAGSTLTLTGTGFDANPSVRFSGTSGAYATVSSYTSTSIVATVPTLAPGSYSVYASNASGNSASLTYSITASTGAPTITSISPSSGSGSVPITITGTGFNATQNLVFLGGIGGLCGLSYLTSTASGTSIACTLGLGGWSTGTYSLTVKNVTTGLTSTGVNFTVSAPRVLSITTVSPTSGIAASEVHSGGGKAVGLLSR